MQNLPSFLKPPKSYFWRSHTLFPESWKIDADREIQRITQMSRNELIEYIKDLTGTIPPEMQFHSLRNKNFDDGRRAGDVYLVTINSIFGLLESRLEKVELNHINELIDINNVETVMNGDISSSDYTVLYLVHQSMIKHAKKQETMKQRQENRKCRRTLLGYIHRFEVCIGEKFRA